MVSPVLGGIETAVEKKYSSLLKQEPVIVGGIAFGAVNYVLTLLVTHGVITNTQASAVTQQAVSGVAAFLTLTVAFLLRRFVAPAWKAATGRELPTEFSTEVDADPEPELDLDDIADALDEEQLTRLAGRVAEMDLALAHPTPGFAGAHAAPSVILP